MKRKIVLILKVMLICFVSISSKIEAKAQKDLSVQNIKAKLNDSAPYIKLSDALTGFKERFGVDVLFVEKVVGGIEVSTKLVYANEPAEVILNNILSSVGLKYKKIRTNLYAVVGDKKASRVKGSLPNSVPTEQKKTEIEPSNQLNLAQNSTEKKASIAISPVGIIINGTVKDDKGEALEGATVAERGTNNKTITDKNGAFKMRVKDVNAIISVSYVGYNEQVLVLNSRTTLSITLNEKPTSLNDVIVIGYGTVRKGDLTGAVSKISGENNTEHPYTSVEQMLQGRVAGVQITQNTGALAGGMTFSIRGVTSISGNNQPLIVIDGYPVSSGSASASTGIESSAGSSPPENILATINPNDIETIEILKDASSTAIYGSRGANGVVIITTKRGKAGKDLIDYSYREDFSNLPKKISVLNNRQYMTFSNEAYSDQNNGTLAYSQSNFNKLLGVNTNWQDLIYQTGISQSHQLTISGGDQKIKYSLSIGYLDQQGIVKATKYQRGTLRLNVEKKVTDNFSYGVNVAATRSFNKSQGQSNLGLSDASVISGALRTAPIQVPFLQDGALNQLGGFSNPLTLVEYGVDENRVLLANISGFVDYKILEGLNLKVRAGCNPSDALRNFYWPRGTYVGNTVNGEAYQGTNNNMDYLTETTLTYNKVIGRHRINAVTGYTYQDATLRSGGMTVAGFPNDALGYTNFGTATVFYKPVNFISESGLASYLLRANYVNNDRYLFTATARYDGSTRLADGHKWALFPAVAAGWNLNKESFLRDNRLISQLKIRMSYGVSGNQSAGIGSTASQYYSGTTVIAQAITTGYTLPRLANPLLGWENTKQFNAGVDFGMLNDRFTLTADFYDKTTSDLLINLVIPATSGFTSYTTNVGVIDNKGLEISANYQVLTGGLKWTLGGNIAFNKNKVVSFYNSVPSILSPSFGPVNSQNISIATVGQPVAIFYGYKVIGIYQSQQEIDGYSGGAGNSINAKPGYYKIADLNGDGKITPDDRTTIGSPYPKYFFGITNTFNWKNLSLNVLIQGSIGQHVANTNRYYLDGMTRAVGTNIRTEAYNNRWTGPGTSNKYPIPQSAGLPFYGFFTDFIIEDASYIRVKSVVLSYSVKIPRMAFLKNLKVFVSGNNLWTLTKYSGYDPEINSAGSNSLLQGIDNGSIPQYRTISGGVSVSF